MINKNKIWFVSVLSIIILLSFYYFTNPEENNLVFNDLGSKEIKATISETEDNETITVMKINRDNDNLQIVQDLQNILLNNEKNTDEKNEAYEKIKSLNQEKTLEEKLEKLLNNELKLSSFIDIKDTTVNVTIVNSEDNYELANKIINLINKETKNIYYTSVKFE